MTYIQRTRRRRQLENLESRMCLSSVGWDGPGQGSAALTYYIGDAPTGLSQSEVDAAIETALDAWSDVADIQFSRTLTPNLRDSIDFEFTQIDGQNGTLARAYFPDDVNPARIAGDVEFDIAEAWEIGNARGRDAVDLTLVAAHEIGHSLGIDHLPTSSAVLHSTVSSNQAFTGLSSADVDAVLSLYAPSIPPPPPTTLTVPTPEITEPHIEPDPTDEIPVATTPPLTPDVDQGTTTRWRFRNWQVNRWWQSWRPQNNSTVHIQITDLSAPSHNGAGIGWRITFRFWHA